MILFHLGDSSLIYIYIYLLGYGGRKETWILKFFSKWPIEFFLLSCTLPIAMCDFEDEVTKHLENNVCCNKDLTGYENKQRANFSDQEMNRVVT